MLKRLLAWLKNFTPKKYLKNFQLKRYKNNLLCRYKINDIIKIALNKNFITNA